MQAPMIIASGLDLVLASCRAGVIGAFSAGNPRAPDTFEAWLDLVSEAESRALNAGETFAPWCVNLPAARQIASELRRSRLEACRKARAPLLLTNLGDPRL